jgi:uncharacterized membrane protein YphA (DoxX/SURF4 family)
MKLAINIIRIFVGLLFIFSGLVKANDPLGTAYKMEEYFEVWNADLANSTFFLKGALTSLFHFFNEHTLFLSVTMNAFEIIAGAALLVGWRMKLFSWLLLLLMIFFTILTGYTYQTGRPTNCGCFGDCIKITPEYSFYKDVLLSVLILILLFTKKHIRPLFKPAVNTALMLLVTIFSFGLQWYALKYLPPVDCLPFKKGNSIPEKMKMPADAIPDVFQTRLVYKNINSKEVKDMSQDEFNNSKIWEDSTWKWDTTITRLIKKGKNNEPPIKGFSLSGPTVQDTVMGTENKLDLTQEVLSKAQAVVVFFIDLPGGSPGWKNDLLVAYNEAKKRGIPFYFVTSNRTEFLPAFEKMGFEDPQVLSCDFTVIRTAARVSPTLYLLKNGIVNGKWSYPNFDDAANAIAK